MTATTTPKLIAYIRVSTKKQGDSGLGLEGQQAAIERHRASCGGIVVAEYREVETAKETGRKGQRPELGRALAHAKRAKATLVIAKLDRLSRDVAFTANLMNAGADFVACDNPNASRLTIHILAAVAEDEARRISERTKTALAALKARGVKLGSAREGAPRLTGGANPEASRLAGLRAASDADDAYFDLAPRLRAMRAEGATLQSLADLLNSEGSTTRRGQPWNKMQVSRVIDRHSESNIG